MLLKGGQNICGTTIGVLCLDSKFPKPPGHIKNPSSLGFPVIYETVQGATVRLLIEQPSNELLEPFIQAVKKLETEGVRAITGSCGFLALYQEELARAVNVPVFISSLIQVPMVYTMLGGQQQVGILTANAKQLTDRHFAAVGATDIPVIVEGMESYAEFNEVILQGKRDDMDISLIESEIMDAALKLTAKNNIGAIVLECTDMPPYAHNIQKITGLPVFDLTTLTTMVHGVVSRKSYDGIMPGIYNQDLPITFQR
jgi:Asp/Glu/hydantoin racemase